MQIGDFGRIANIEHPILNENGTPPRFSLGMAGALNLSS
jgi:hypothetical protein